MYKDYIDLRLGDAPTHRRVPQPPLAAVTRFTAPLAIAGSATVLLFYWWIFPGA